MIKLTQSSALFVAAALLSSSAGLAASQTTGTASPDLGNSEPADQAAAGPGASGSTSTLQNGVGDIIVTAQRRSENVQKSSLSISVLSAEQISRQGVTSTQDISRVAPGIQIGAAGSTPQIYIRGVGDPGTTAVTNPAVALNVSGVYAARPASAGAAFYDLARIEVLKGPQGTLYGRNASGGAINLLPIRPRLGTTEALLNFEAGNYGLIDSDGGVNLPIGGELALRASYQVRQRNGYLSDGSSDDIRQAARLQLLFAPSSALSVLLYGSYAHQGGIGTGSVLYDPQGNPAGTPPRPPTPPFSPWTSITDGRAAAILATLAKPPVLVPGNAASLYQNNHYWNLQAEIVADVGFAKLTVIPAYQHSEIDYHIFPSIDFQTRIAAGKGRPELDTTYSGEVRLSNDGERLKWVLGGFYYDEDQRLSQTLNNGLIQNVSSDAAISTRSAAAFGNATYSLSDQLRVIAGLRYTDDKRSIGGFRYNNLSSITVPTTKVSGTSRSKHVDYKTGVEYDVTSRNLLYAVFATGYKAGGSSNAVSTPYLPETVQSYTLGSRNRFLDNHVQINVEGFYLKYKNEQVQVIGPDDVGVISGLIRNAGRATSYGIEGDLVLQLSTRDRLTCDVTYNYTNDDKFVFQQPAVFLKPGTTGCSVVATGMSGAAGPIGQVDCSGHQLIRAPKWSGSIGYSHVADLGPAGSLTFNGDMQFASAREATNDFIGNSRVPGYQVFNAALTYALQGDQLSMTGYVRNIGNEAVYLGGMEGTFVPSFVSMSIAPPRTFGLRLSYRY